MENCNDEKRQTNKKIETKRSKYHFSDGKVKAMEYYDFNNTRLQEQPCDYCRSLS